MSHQKACKCILILHWIFPTLLCSKISTMYLLIYRSKIEKEFAENPLIRSLGITIYGSVHDTRQREKADRKVCM